MALINPDNFSSGTPVSLDAVPVLPSINDGNNVANGLDQEISQSPEQWLSNYISEKFPHNPFIATAEGWSHIMSQGLKEGALTPDDVMSLTSRTNMSFTPEFEKQLNNMVSKQNALDEYNREIAARDSSVLSTVSQLKQLGMSSSYLSSIGGASAGINSSAALTDMSNIGKAKKMADFNRKTSMAKTMLGILGGMASAGIYGSSMLAGKKAVAELTTSASKEAARIRSAGGVAAAQVRLNARRRGKSRYDRNGNFIDHEVYDY